MPSTTPFARKADNKSPRQLRFIRDLSATHAAHLHDHLQGPASAVPKADPCTTQRLRPEVMAAVAALKARYAARHDGAELTVSEIIAAALVIAVPVMTKGSFRQ